MTRCLLPEAGIAWFSGPRVTSGLLALGAARVLYMPHVFNVPQLCGILASGANVVSTRMELPQVVARLGSRGV